MGGKVVDYRLHLFRRLAPVTAFAGQIKSGIIAAALGRADDR